MLGLNPMQSQSIYDALDQFENQCELIMPNRVAPGQNIEVTFVSDAKLLPAGQALTLLITNAQGEPVIERLSSLTPQSTPLYSGTTFTDVLISQEGTYSAVVVAPNGNAVAEKSLMVRDGAYTVKPLFELFTSSTCGPCASANPVIDAVLAQNIGNHSIIKYQVDFPGAGDPYCNADVGIRRAFYPAVTGVPALIPNGNNGNPTTPHVMSQGFYDSFQGLPTDMQIVVTEAEIDDNNMVSVNLSIDVAETYAEGLKLHIAIIEKTTVGNVGSNGEVEFHNVMMKMLPDGNGTTLPALNPGTPYTMSQTYDMDLTFMEDANDLEVVVFVQNSADKSIVQSEMVPVGSELDSYAITFNIKDESNNAIQGATIFMENQGTRTTNSTGVAIYNDVLPGSYDYEIEAAGFNSISGTATVDNNDVNIDIVMESPGFYFYEDFTDAPAMGIPDGWASIASASDFVYCTGGEAILFRQNSAMNPLILISPLIDLEPAEHITFDFGKGQGAVEAILGYMTDPEDAETFVDVETFNPTAAWDEFVLDVSSINGGMGEVYLAWKLTSGVTTYFSLDNVALTHKGGDDQTYSVTFNVKDNAENPLSGAAVTLQGHGTKQTNASGLALFEEVEPGTYSYQIIAAGFVTANDEVEVVNADVTENVQMQLPGYYYLEDFSEHPDYDVPEDWTKIVTPSDMVYCAGGAAILFRQSGAMNPIILASPLIDLEPAGELMFDYGDGSGAEGEFGYMIDLSDPESFVTVSEFSPSSSWKSDTISVSNINGGNGAVYLAWRITSGMFTYFSLDDVRLTYKGDEEALAELPYFEDFEGEFPPVGWSFVNTHPISDSNWHQGEGNSSAGALEVFWVNSDLMDEWAISPTFDLSGVSSDIEFSFDFLASYIWQVEADGADIMVKVSTDGGTNWIQIWREEDFGVFENWVWSRATVPFTQFAGEPNVKFAFHYLGSDGAQVSIDNVKLDYATGINEDVSVNVASVYPNPSDGLVNVKVIEKSVVTVVDISGRTVGVYNVDANETLSFRQASGMYILKVLSEGKVSSHKLIVK